MDSQEPLSVETVKTPKQFREFHSLKRKVYCDDPAVVFPLRSMERLQLDENKHPFYQHASREMFACYRGSEIVGRIVAIKDDLHNQHCGDLVGFFGFFEAIDDQNVVDRLIDAATAWLKAKGCDRIRGPVNPSMKSDFGVVVEGNEFSPMIMMGHSPRRYQQHLEEAGFEVIRQFSAYNFVSTDVPQSTKDKWDRIEEIEKKAFKRYPQLNIKTVSAETFDETIRQINELGNTVRSEGWGFVPLTDAELDFMISNLRRVIRYETIHVAYWEDRLIGYIVSIPDVNWALKRTKGSWDWLRMIQMPGLIKKTPQARVIALGVDPDYRSKGAAMILIRRLAITYDWYKEWEFSWVDDENVKSIRAIAKTLPLVKTKAYRLFEKEI